MENKQLKAKYNLSSQILEAEQAAKDQLMNRCLEYDQRIQSLENDLNVRFYELIITIFNKK